MTSSSGTTSKAGYERFTQYFHYSKVTPLSDGDILFTSDINGQFNIWRQEISKKLAPRYQRMLTAFHDRTVRDFVLTPDEKRIFFMADQDGDERHQLYVTPTAGGEVEALTSDREVTHTVSRGAVNGTGSRLLYTSNGRSRKDFDVIIRELKSGKESMPLEQGSLWGEPQWDSTGNRFTAVKQLSNTDVRSFIYDLKRKKTREIMPHKEEAIVYSSGWTADGRVAVVTDMDNDFSSLLLHDPVKGKNSVVYSGKHDVESVFAPRTGNRLFFAINNEGYSEVYSYKPGGKTSKLKIKQKGWLYFSGISGDQRGKRIGMVWTRESAPPELLLYDSAAQKSAFVTDSMTGGVPTGIPKPELIHYKSFDGRMIPAFYYPAAGTGRRSPAILSIHGGPESQERPFWGYAGLYQYLQASGIALLCPNIRGSTGYGKKYQKMIHRDWGGGELKDLEHAAKWLESRKEIDGSRLAVFGGSFGGFATLSCVSRLPSHWKAGVDICGPSNLVTFCKSVPPFWMRFMKEWVGDPEEDADFLMERSPISHIDKVKADMLIIQGANDPRVVKAESDQMVDKLRKMGRETEYMVFEDEGHGFTKTENARKAFSRCADFLVKKLS